MGYSDLLRDGEDANVDNISGGLASVKTFKRLNQIDHVRALGVGDHVELPQIVVCGDQSVGKSSVLEGISGCPFPRQDGLCTRFPTEIMLRHSPSVSKKAVSLIPCASRTPQERVRFAAFSREFESFDELPAIIQEASHEMGIRSREIPDGPAFAADVLRLEVIGNTGLHLTLVDLPGLISVAENTNDIEMVRGLVDSYLQSSRTIIIAVIPASSDAETQTILQRARHFDKEGLRTIGIITKPDLINKGTEERVARLVKNLDQPKLHHGYFLVKNPSPEELKDDISFEQRVKTEREFFSSARWAAQGIDPSRIGNVDLRKFLQDLLDSHIERELPKVREDMHHLLQDIGRVLADLGPERSQPSQIRTFLTRVSTEFQSIVKNGLEGHYDPRTSSLFAEGDPSLNSRLRAAVHIENERFAEFMRKHGKQRRVVSGKDVSAGESAEDASQDSATEPEPTEKREGDELLVTKEEMLAWVKKIYLETRGRELPGNYNPSLLQGLFYAQSALWGKISRAHVDGIVVLVTQFLNSVFKSVLKDITVRDKLWKDLKTAFDNNVENSHEELGKLLQDEQGHPITYNHYYIENIQKLRSENSKELLDSAVRNATWNYSYNARGEIIFSSVDKLVGLLHNNIEVNMVGRACSEALVDLNAYYKVAMKTFVDNVCRQVIERHILAPLPKVFDPTIVSDYSDEDLLRLAAESAQTIRRRTEALRVQKALKECLRELSL